MSALGLDPSVLTLIVEQMPSGFALAEAPSGKLLLYNREALALLRHPMLPSETYERYANYGALHEDGTPYKGEEYPLARALAGETVKDHVMKYRRGDGTLTYLAVNAAPIRSADGHVVAAASTFHDISNRTELALALAADLNLSRERLNQALRAARMVVWEHDLDTGLVTYTETAAEVLGTVPGSAIDAENWFALVDPRDAPRFRADIERAVKEGSPYASQFRMRRPEGTGAMWVEAIGRPVTGRNRAVTGVLIDVTERREQQERLRQVTEALERHLTATPLAVVEYTADFRITRWTSSAERIFGWTADETVGRRLGEWRWVFEEDAPAIERIVTGMLAGETRTCVSPNRNYTKDGTVVYMEWYNSTILDAEGNLQSVLSLGLDITARKRAEEALAHSEDMFRTLANSIPQLAWMAQPDGSIFWYNQRWYDYTGSSFDEMRGWGWQNVHHPDHVQRVIVRFQHAVASGVAWEDTFPLRGKDGSWRQFLSRAQPIRDDNGQIVRWFGTNTDITEQLDTIESLRRANAELEEFAFVSSHDLREPLRMINVYSELLVRRYASEDDERARMYAQFVRRGVQRMEALITDLLGYSRIVHGEKTAATYTAAEDALTLALESMRDQIGAAEAIVDIGELPIVCADASQLGQVFQNLISNALKYRKPDETLVVTVRARSEGTAWVISVADNGIGFDQCYAERIFGLFKRLHRDEYPGTGLGLAICKRIVERYGGRIWAQSAPGQGSTFSFTLPGAAG